ncbi:hypothetical protein BGL_2c14130 [Burkholderia plantarii]|uniref:Uncharacterized protein n=1 Tax=Burkholderia plantarii TaxID=41899 RepID=A0A0B6S867_BURPL|nr:hypothetical protein BGL_2c14130 [Burkholderia plantarii]
MARWHDHRAGVAGETARPPGAAPKSGTDIAVSHDHGHRAGTPERHHFYQWLENDMAKKPECGVPFLSCSISAILSVKLSRVVLYICPRREAKR